MGMLLALTTASDTTLARLHAEPALVMRLLMPDDPEAWARAAGTSANAGRGGWWRRLLGLPSGVARGAPPALALRPDEGREMDLDKSWHGLHYLLTGTADGGTPPLDFLVKGGRPIGDVDVGYGPARSLDRADVRSLEAALRALPDATLRGRFDPADMRAKDIYPVEIWGREADGEDPLGYIMDSLDTLRAFLAAAVRDGLGVVLTLG